MELKPDRIYIVLEYLRLGGKVPMDGRTFVWLNNQVVNETPFHKFIIDGLAIEGRSYGPGEDWEDPKAGKTHYMGQGDMPISHFIQHVSNIKREDFICICQDLAELRKNS